MIEEERAAVLLEAMSWVGTPFIANAQVKGAGVDCAHLLIAAFAQLEPVAPVSYPSDWFLHSDRERLLEMIEPRCVPVTTPALADIVVFRFGRAVSHAGIIVELEPLRMVHAFRPSRGVQVDELGEGSGYQTRLAGFWRLRRWMEG